MGWILNKGLRLGKKVVVTGIMISSAPLVLPPLVVFSALGLAFSVPYGILFTSYACTDKLMSKLLSRPTSPLVFKYETDSTDDEETSSVRGEIDMEKEEEKLLEDTKERIETRIELIDKECERTEEGKFRAEDNYVQGGAYMDEQRPIDSMNEIVKEEGYEEDDEDLVEDKEEQPVYVSIEGMREEEEVESVIKKTRDEQPVGQGVVILVEGGAENAGNVEEPFGVTGRVAGENGGAEKVIDEIEDEEELLRETTGLIERMRDEVDVKNGVEEDEQRVKKTCLEGEINHDKILKDAEEMERKFGDEYVIENLMLEKPIGEMEGVIEETKDGRIPEENELTKEMRNEGDINTIPKLVRPVEEIEGELERNINEKHVDSIVEVEMPIGDKSETVDMGHNTAEEQKPTVVKKAILRGGRAKVKIVSDTDFQLNREKEEKISSNSDAREIADECGLDLFDEQCSCVVYNRPEEYEQSPIDASEKRAVSLEHPVSAGLLESSSDNVITMPFSEPFYNEEKIWEHIEALRTIVGYKTAPQATCVEELKALYIFTGVEPPVSFKDPSDLVDVNVRLRFLMSIVGVK